ncbi:universal stress protein [Kribbella sp. NPDC050124]|uniref:universal stress protein n=1 Tax=Kribbella sp. NPDC050124 TaxID=3364114 RepID=UPI0037B48F11
MSSQAASVAAGYDGLPAGRAAMRRAAADAFVEDAPHARALVVGIDGSRDGLTALAWAVRHAARRGLALCAVHVVDDDRPSSDTPPVGYDDGSGEIEEAAAELDRLGFTDATAEVRHGHPASVLLDLASAGGSTLVIGRRGLGGFAELVVGSTSQVCASLSTGTLVVVPDEWNPDAAPHGRVVVGVDDSADCQAALGFAFETADLEGAELKAVHAANLPESYPATDLWIDPAEQPWLARSEVLVTEALAGWREKYPEVTVRTSCTDGHPVQLLALESGEADLVVVGGRGRTRYTPLLLGSVARGLLHHTKSPVAVIHHESRPAA